MILKTFVKPANCSLSSGRYFVPSSGSFCHRRHVSPVFQSLFLPNTFLSLPFLYNNITVLVWVKGSLWNQEGNKAAVSIQVSLFLSQLYNKRVTSILQFPRAFQWILISIIPLTMIYTLFPSCKYIMALLVIVC